MGNRITVIGSSNMDMIVQVNHLPGPGETVLGGEFSQAHGGKGANQAVAAARAGGEVTFITAVGDDSFGTQFIEGFQSEGIETKHVVSIPNAASGIALITVDASGENSIAVAPGANARLTPEHIEGARNIIEQSDIVLLQLEIPLETVMAAVEIAAESDVDVILNPAPAQDLPEKLLSKVAYITPNESEAALLTGRKNSGPAETVKMLLQTGIRNVILTLGADGVYWANNQEQQELSAFKVTPVDTTAAGDVFNGALAVALSNDRSLTGAIRFASAAAALSVTKLGAQPSAPVQSEIAEFLSAQ